MHEGSELSLLQLDYRVYVWVLASARDDDGALWVHELFDCCEVADLVEEHCWGAIGDCVYDQYIFEARRSCGETFYWG